MEKKITHKCSFVGLNTKKVRKKIFLIKTKMDIDYFISLNVKLLFSFSLTNHFELL